MARIPPPTGSPEAPLQALIFDSWFDQLPWRGGAGARRPGHVLTVGMRIKLWSNNQVYNVEELGVLTPKPVRVEQLEAGEVGFVIANIKRISESRIGDTITDDARPAAGPLARLRRNQVHGLRGPLSGGSPAPMRTLRDAIEKLRLNDASLFYEPENSEALGFGFRCGFLGLLHMEIVQERLEREFDIDLITTAPSVRYRITTKAGEVLEVHTPTKFPPAGDIEKVEEPIIRAQIFTQDEYLGGILALLEEKRGVQKGFEYVSRQARAADLRAAAERNRPGLLRPAQVGLARLRVARLSFCGLLGLGPGQGGFPGGG